MASKCANCKITIDKNSVMSMKHDLAYCEYCTPIDSHTVFPYIDYVKQSVFFQILSPDDTKH